jgi:hypothetical protein
MPQGSSSAPPAGADAAAQTPPGAGGPAGGGRGPGHLDAEGGRGDAVDGDALQVAMPYIRPALRYIW